MSTAGAASASAASAAAAVANAIKASGVLVRIEPSEFMRIIERQPEPLVVHATGGFFRTNYQYLTSYKGLAFFTKALEPLILPSKCETIQAGSIAIPG